MSVPARLLAFAAAMILAFGAAAVVGAAVGPIDVGNPTPMDHTDEPVAPATTHPDGH
jgi:hypothetical protein